MGGFDKNSFSFNKKVKVFYFSFIFIIIAMIFSIIPIKKAFAETKNYCSAMVVIEQSSKRVLKASNENAALPMASTTKIATAITALENASLTDVVEIPKIAVGVEGSSIYLKEGERLTLEELLYGLMLRSGNDAATAIALHVGKDSIENFCSLMNETAKRAGAERTNFVNPHGLPADNHYTTALDLAKITAYAYNNETFAKIAATKNIRFEEESGNVRVFVNKNKILSRYEGGNGVKTGYTKEAGRCLVSAAKRGDMQLICVVLNCPMMWEDSEAYMDECFSDYEQVKIARKGELPDRLYLDEEGKAVRMSLQRDLYYPVKKGETLEFDFEIGAADNLETPVKCGDKVAYLKIYHDKRLIFDENIYSMDNAKTASAQKFAGHRSVIVNGKTE